MSRPPDHQDGIAHSKLLPILDAVRSIELPASFSQRRGQSWKDCEDYHSLLEWKDVTAPYRLKLLLDLLPSLQDDEIDPAERSNAAYLVVLSVAKFYPIPHVGCEWATEKSAELAQSILASQPTTTLAPRILSSYLRPLFSATIVDPATGRRARSPLLGVGHHHSAWEDESSTPYKSIGGLGSCHVLAFVLSLPLEWEEVWYLLVPPLVSLLQDTEPSYRLIGAGLLGSLAAPPALVRKTGIWALFESALHANLSFTNDELGPQLIAVSANALRKLVLDHTQGKQRFDALCRLVEDAVVSVWAFTPAPGSKGAQDLTVASCTIFEALCEDLGVGCARFVKVAVEWLAVGWLAHCDQPNEASARVISALRACLENAGPVSAKRWRETVLANLAKWWISTEGKQQDEALALLRTMTRLDSQTLPDLQKLARIDGSLARLASAI